MHHRKRGRNEEGWGKPGEWTGRPKGKKSSEDSATRVWRYRVQGQKQKRPQLRPPEATVTSRARSRVWRSGHCWDPVLRVGTWRILGTLTWPHELGTQTPMKWKPSLLFSFKRASNTDFSRRGGWLLETDLILCIISCSKYSSWADNDT